MDFKKMIRNLLVGFFLAATCIPMSVSAQVALAEAGLRSGVMELDCGGVDTTDAEFESIVQHYCFITHQLIDRSVKNRADNAVLSARKAALVHKVEQEFQPTINTVRKEFFAGSKERAVQKFASYVLGLCREFGLRKYYIIFLPATVDEHMSIDRQVGVLKRGVALLELLYRGITPLPPLTTRVKNKLFYNFFSTKVLPKIILGSGVVTTYVWSVKNIMHYQKAINRHPHNDDVLYKYQRVDHDASVERQRSLFERKLRGVIAETPFGRERGSGIERLVRGIADMVEPVRVGLRPSSRSASSGARSAPPTFQPCRKRGNGHLCNSGLGNYLRSASCNVECNECYAYMGINSPHVLLKRGLWALRPLIAIPVAKFLADYTYDAQIDEYNHRVQQKQKRVEEQKIHAEMRRMKVHYETAIGFEQIKGQRDLIDREMRMIVDYLKHPFRYKNGSSGTRSILLYGPPGTGKTLLARAIAKESGAPFLEITADDILSDSSKEKVLATMRLAEEVASRRAEKSAIIYIDEIDCVTGDRSQGILDPQRAKALSNLLAIFDGIEKRNPYVHVVIIITTNHYKTLDAALLRPGRIDRKVLIAQPDAEGRKEFFKELLPEERKHLMGWLIEESNGYSGAQIVNVVDTAQMIASYNGRPIPDDADYRAAVANCKAEFAAVPDAVKVN